MLRRVAPAFIGLAAVLATTWGGGVAAHAATSRPTVYEIPITGPVDPFVANMVNRGLDRAQRAHAAAVLVRLDTPGGLDSSMRSIIKKIQKSTVPVICWVGPSGARAASAGAFILIGCPLAAMAPGTNVGAAHPVGLTGNLLSEKVTNDAVAYIRSLAEQRRRNVGWAERAVRDSVSVSAVEAKRIDVIDFIAGSPSAVLAAADGRRVATSTGTKTLAVSDAEVNTVHLSVGEWILHQLDDPNIAFVFFVLGIAGLIFEILHPGINIPGVIGLILLVCSLMILSVLPVNVGALVLLAAAFIFFVLDLKVHAHGVATFAGILCLVFGGLFLFDGAVPNAQVSRPLIFVIAIAIGAFFAFAVRKGIEARHQPVRTGAVRIVGHVGKVTDTLAPAGHVRVRGEIWSARLVTPGVVAPVGAEVRVLEVRGLVLDVELLDAAGRVDESTPKSEVT